MASDLDVVRTVADDHLRHLVSEDGVERLRQSTIAANDQMIATSPTVAWPGYRRAILRNDIIIGIAVPIRWRLLGDEAIDFNRLEAKQINDLGLLDSDCFDVGSQQLIVPGGIDGELVVSDHHRVLFGVGQPDDLPAWVRAEANRPGDLSSRMAGEDRIVFVDEGRAGRPEAPHVIGQDAQLFLRVAARVVRPRPEFGRITLNIGENWLGHLRSTHMGFKSGRFSYLDDPLRFVRVSWAGRC